MAYLLGTILAFSCIRVSLYFLDQSLGLYFDDVALTMVVGGTFAVAVISLPWNHSREVWRSLAGILVRTSATNKGMVEEALDFVRKSQQGKPPKSRQKHIAGDLLVDGRELLDLNFSTDDIHTILQERLHQYIEKKQQIAEYFMSLAKYPPAFGLVGTVLGLVNLMRAITDGLPPSQTGVKMALALVATLYGLVFANFFVAPIGEAIGKQVNQDRFHGEIALQAVLLAADQTSLLKSQEMLNSFVSRRDRVDVIENALTEMKVA